MGCSNHVDACGTINIREFAGLFNSIRARCFVAITRLARARAPAIFVR